MFKTLLIPITMALMPQISPAAEAWKLDGKVIHVEDGDTLTIMLDDHSKYSIRLTDIDAPETSHGPRKLGQPFSKVS